MITQNYNERTNILEVHYIGKITLDVFEKYGISIMNNNELPRKLKILTDAREAKYNYSDIDLKKINKQMKIHLKDYTHVKNALIYSSPVETAISMLSQKEIKQEKYHQKIFYQKKEAIKWLLES